MSIRPSGVRPSVPNSNATLFILFNSSYFESLISNKFTISIEIFNESSSLIYVNCNENDQIDGEKIGTIVNYVIDVLKSSTQKKNDIDPDSGKEIYQKYSRALSEMFGSLDEYVKTLEIKEIKKGFIINEMMNLQPYEI